VLVARRTGGLAAARATVVLAGVAFAAGVEGVRVAVALTDDLRGVAGRVAKMNSLVIITARLWHSALQKIIKTVKYQQVTLM
jgi:hypothetical protein